VLRRISGPKREEVVVRGAGENYIIMSFVICTLHNIVLR
jgi:hypothetical protein